MFFVLNVLNLMSPCHKEHKTLKTLNSRHSRKKTQDVTLNPLEKTWDSTRELIGMIPSGPWK